MTQTHSETALLYSSYFDAKERDRVCFHFWYSLQHSFAVDSVSVDVTRDSKCILSWSCYGLTEFVPCI